MLPQPLHLPLHSPSVCPSTAPPSALPQPLHPPTHRPSIHSAPTLPCQDLTVWITEESRNCTTNSAGASLQRHRCTSAAPPPAAQASAPQNGISFPKQHLPGPSGLSSPSPLPPPRPPQARARALHPSLGTVCPCPPAAPLTTARTSRAAHSPASSLHRRTRSARRKRHPIKIKRKTPN